MYIPKHFLNSDQDEAVVFMQKYSFATLVTAEQNIPVATHLPFLIQKIDDRIILSSHFAKANPQAAAIAGSDILVIFTEPHAYISPRFYERDQNVPTWNYLAVHAYGKATIIEDEAGKLALMERTIVNYEAKYLEQWRGLSNDYKLKMLKGIV
ncbi:MAG TPA: FMN-binding negative transcriptional regulator, partial [Sphingobacteriaceae bacterium]